jgi:hypothetical protein
MKGVTQQPRRLKSVLPGMNPRKPDNLSSAPLNFAESALAGFYFCLACQAVTQRVQRGVNFVCVHCGSCRVKFCPPVSV